MSVFQRKHNSGQIWCKAFIHLFFQVIPAATEEQLLLVELVRSVSAMRTETVIQTVKEVLKQPPAIAKDKVSFDACP